MPAPRGRKPAAHQGYTLIELLLLMTVALVLASLAIGSLEGLRSDARALGAARYLASRLAATRLQAIAQGRTLGLHFRGDPPDITFQAVADGNGNGLRTPDVALGIDAATEPETTIGRHFEGVAFEVAHTMPPPGEDETAIEAGGDPIRIGTTSFLSFGPDGTATSGTLYLATRERRQLAVRIFGPTGRIRVLEYLPAAGTWVPR
jgi:type II secretory pathway pseudopilin PulG